METPKPLSDSNILEGLPQGLKSKSQLLLDRLNNMKDFSWDESGEVTLDGVKRKGTNIKQLIAEAARDRKTAPEARGWEAVSDKLKNEGVPTTFIGNKKWKNYMQNPKTL